MGGSSRQEAQDKYYQTLYRELIAPILGEESWAMTPRNIQRLIVDSLWLRSSISSRDWIETPTEVKDFIATMDMRISISVGQNFGSRENVREAFKRAREPNYLLPENYEGQQHTPSSKESIFDNLFRTSLLRKPVNVFLAVMFVTGAILGVVLLLVLPK